ncbi:hypothetical protein BaRGS_00000736 [Batillaria attramentaria]|uniref:Uncharacterized protein n=1 Tax=Batillaria attramentaria TaxID=370345 RepID=A0ABD0M8S0_9CAEN
MKKKATKKSSSLAVIPHSSFLSAQQNDQRFNRFIVSYSETHKRLLLLPIFGDLSGCQGFAPDKVRVLLCCRAVDIATVLCLEKSRGPRIRACPVCLILELA